MTYSKIQNVLLSALMGAVALVSVVGCAADGDLTADETASAEPAASVTEASSVPDYCSAPYVDQYHAKEWKYYGQYSWLSSQYWYATYNTYIGKYLKYAYRNPGVDLYYYEGNPYYLNMKYEREYPGDVHYYDHVAIKVGNRGYLHYAQQPSGYGFDITYQDYPSYEWEVRGGEYGWKVPTNYQTSIYNDYRNDYMVYCQREYGLAMSWASECHDSQYGRYYHNDYCYGSGGGGGGGGDY